MVMIIQKIYNKIYIYITLIKIRKLTRSSAKKGYVA